MILHCRFAVGRCFATVPASMGECPTPAASSGVEGCPERRIPGSSPHSNTGMEYIQVREYGDLPGIIRGAPFKAVLAIEDQVSRERQREISDWLVAKGCLYAMVCGQDCESWQDSIRQANLDRVPIEDMQPQQFVMITMHIYEKLRVVYRFAKKHAHHTHVKIDHMLTIHVSNRNREVEYHNLFNRR